MTCSQSASRHHLKYTLGDSCHVVNTHASCKIITLGGINNLKQTRPVQLQKNAPILAAFLTTDYHQGPRLAPVSRPLPVLAESQAAWTQHPPLARRALWQ